MTLDELLEQFDEVLDSGIKIPGRKTVVDVEKLRAVVDDIRLNIPAEIKQAKGIVADRADIITNAKREARYYPQCRRARKGYDRTGRNCKAGTAEGGGDNCYLAAEEPRNAQSRAGFCGRYYAPCRRRAYRQLRRSKKNPRRIKAANTLCKRKLS